MDKKRVFIIISIICVLFIFLANNVFIPFIADDISWIPKNDSSIFQNILDRQYHHYMTQNGRITCHTILQLLVWAGEGVFNLFNTLVFAAVLFITCKLSSTKQGWWSIIFWALIILEYLYLIPDASSLFYWAAGACNYLLSIFLCGSFLLLLRKIHTARVNKVVQCLLLCFAFIAGWSHEAFVLPIAFTLIPYLYLNRKKVTLFEILYIVSFWVGGMLIVVSPGSMHRLGVTNSTTTVQISFFAIILEKVLCAFKIFREGRMLYVLFAILLYNLIRNRRHFIDYIKKEWFLFSCFILSCGVSAALGAGGRAVLPAEFYSFVLVCRYLDNYTNIFDNKWLEKISLLLITLMIIHHVFICNANAKMWGEYRNAVEQIDEPGFDGTVYYDYNPIDNPLISNFIKDPYRELMTSYWMRFPFKCQFTTLLTKEELQRMSVEEYNQWDEVRFVGNDYLIKKSSAMLNLISKNKVVFRFMPIAISSTDSDTPWMAALYHTAISHIFPSRYPSSKCVGKDDYDIIKIDNKEYIRFYVPNAPIRRTISSIYILQ